MIRTISGRDVVRYLRDIDQGRRAPRGASIIGDLLAFAFLLLFIYILLWRV